MTTKTNFTVALAFGATLVLAGCDDTNLPAFMQKSASNDSQSAGTTTNRTSKTVERDVEAPEVFKLAEKGLWDGRPSLGGVWVAHPDAKDPERVIVRNEANGKFVIGALFRREKDLPGPRFQVSSDAAQTLEMLAGQPANLTVTALRKEEVAPEAPPQEATLEKPAEVKSSSLDDPIQSAAAALDRAEGVASPTPPKPAAVAKPSTGGLSKPFVQIGIFSVEQNAKNSAESLRGAGMVPTIKPGSSKGKKFWRVLVGPATSSSERAAILKKIKALGFTDAYFVTN